MIPDHRPVIGRDLEALRQHLGLSTHDMIWLLQLSISRWTQIIRHMPDAPLSDPTLALLVRFLARHSAHCLLPAAAQPTELFDWMQSTHQVELQRFATYFGNEASAGYRWMHPSSPPSATVQRLMQCLRAAMQPLEAPERQSFMRQWQSTVEQEAQARGIPDVLQSGRWRMVPIRDNGAASSDWPPA